jgi:hypothetical protein
LEDSHTSLSVAEELLGFYQYVSPSEETRDASSKAESHAKEYEVDASMRLDVFQARYMQKIISKNLGAGIVYPPRRSG